MVNKLKYLAILLFCQPVFGLSGTGGSQLGYVTITSATITNGAKFSNINSGSSQCLHVDGNGNISGSGADCGTGTVTLSSTQTWTGGNTFQSSTTFKGAVVISSGVSAGNGFGSNNQVLYSSAAPNSVYWGFQHFVSNPTCVTTGGDFITSSTSFIPVDSSSFSITVTPNNISSCYLILFSGVIQAGTIGKNNYITIFNTSAAVNIASSFSTGLGDHWVENYPGNAGTQLSLIETFSVFASTCPNTTNSITFQPEERCDSGGSIRIGDSANMLETFCVVSLQ